MTRELLLFFTIGGFQFLVDTSLFATLLAGTGITLLANVTSRSLAALIGFVLNRWVTFRATQASAVSQAWRYLKLWMALTLLSSALLTLWQQLLGDTTENMILMIVGKIAVEVMMMALSFLSMKFWIFNKN